MMENPNTIHNDTLRHLDELHILENNLITQYLEIGKVRTAEEMSDRINAMMNRFIHTFFSEEVGDETV